MHRFISTDVYSEFLCRLSPETTLVSCMAMGFGFDRDRIMESQGMLGRQAGYDMRISRKLFLVVVIEGKPDS